MLKSCQFTIRMVKVILPPLPSPTIVDENNGHCVSPSSDNLALNSTSGLTVASPVQLLSVHWLFFSDKSMVAIFEKHLCL